jgi:hypothetical protein
MVTEEGHWRSSQGKLRRISYSRGKGIALCWLIEKRWAHRRHIWAATAVREAALHFHPVLPALLILSMAIFLAEQSMTGLIASHFYVIHTFINQ